MRIYKVSFLDSYSRRFEYVVIAESDVFAETVIKDMHYGCTDVHSELLNIRGVIDGFNYRFSLKNKNKNKNE